MRNSARRVHRGDETGAAKLLSRLSDLVLHRDDVVSARRATSLDAAESLYRSPAAGIDGAGRAGHVSRLCGNTYDRRRILRHARQTRVSTVADCSVARWIHAPAGIRDIQARKRICQDFRDYSTRMRVVSVRRCAFAR